MFLMYSLVRRKADWFGKLCPEPFFIVSIVEKWFTKLPLLSIPKTIRLEPNSSLTLEFNLSSSVLIGFASQDAVLKTARVPSTKKQYLLIKKNILVVVQKILINVLVVTF